MKTKCAERAAGRAGFTLIELLVVVLIIGILASIAIPQYFRVVERSRLAEAQTFISQIKQAQERQLARQGAYVTDNAKMGDLDIQFGGASPKFGMKYYAATLSGGEGCDPGYKITMARITDSAGVSNRYGAYKLVYNRCKDEFRYENCPGNPSNCDSDFAQ